jgi:hypothetical protein
LVIPDFFKRWILQLSPNKAKEEEMLQQVPIKCPSCGRMVEYLSFWREIEEEKYHLCDDCIKADPINDALFRIGFHYGFQKARDEIRKFLAESRQSEKEDN